MADKRISQLVERTDIENNDVVPIVAFGATTTNKATISSIQTFMQENLDVGVTSVGITLGSTGTDVSVTGSPITTSGNITINIPTASATARGLVSTGGQTFAGIKTFNDTIIANENIQLVQVGTALPTYLQNISGTFLTAIGSNGIGFNGANNIYFAGSNKLGGVIAWNNTGNRIYTLQNASGTLAFTSDLSGFVPYTGANQNVDLGIYPFAASQININGTSPSSGSYLGFKHATTVTTGMNGYTSMYTFGTNTIAFKSVSGATNKDFSFDMSTITSNVSGGRVYSLPDSNGMLALTTMLTDFVTLNTAQTITAQKTITTNGGSDTFIVNHTSGNGIGVNITKAGNGEGLRVAKTSGSGNAVTITGGLLSAQAATLTGALNGTSAVFSGIGTFTTGAAPFYGLRILNYNGLTTDRQLFLGVIDELFQTVGNSYYFNSGFFRSTTTTGSFIDFSQGRFRVFANNGLTADTNYTPTERFSIASTGAATFSSSVGIGVSPDTPLDVIGTNDTGDLIRIRKSSSGSRRGALGTLSGVGYLDLYNDSTDLNIRLLAQGNSYFNGGNVGIGTATVGANGLLQVNGSIGLSGNTQIRQVTNGDGNTLQIFATQFVAGTLNSTSYSYTGGSLIASVSAGDSALLFDSGRSVSTDGRVKVINTTSSNTALTVEKNGVFTLFASTSGNVGIGTATPSFQLQLSTDSAAKPTSALWTIASDERIKENITPYEKGLNELMQINPINYDYNGLGGFTKGKGGVGIIAQEIADILPDSVNSYPAKLNEDDEEETDVLNFNGHELIYVLINSIKELKTEIDSLKNQIIK